MGKKITAAIVILLVIGGVVFLVGSSKNHTKHEPQPEPEPLVIEIPEPCTTGEIVVYDQDNEVVYACEGCTVKIVNDGTNGEDIRVVVNTPGSRTCSCFDD